MNQVAGWLRSASVYERRTLKACVAGWAVDAFDNQIFSFALPALMATFAMTRTDAGLITSLTLVTTAIGGWLGGGLSDRFGRLSALRGSILWFAVGSVFVILAHSPGQLMTSRAIQGFGFGAEWAAGAVLMSEAVSSDYRGRALGIVQSGWALGWGGAALVAALALSLLPDEAAWRTMFAVGLLPAVFALYLTRGIVAAPEGAIASGKSLGLAPATSLAASLFGVFRRENLHGTLAAGLLGGGAHGGYYGLFSWLPTYLKSERGLSVIATSSYLAVIIIAFGAGCIVAGSLSDQFGRRKTIIVYAIGCISVALLYTSAPLGDSIMLALGFPLGFCAAGIPATLGALFSELYPSETRGSGVGFCYNAGRLVAAGFPLAIGMMSEKWSLGAAIATDTAAAYGLVVIAVLLLPNPRKTLPRSAGASAHVTP